MSPKTKVSKRTVDLVPTKAEGSGPRGGMVCPKPDSQSNVRAVKDKLKKQLKIPGFKRSPKTPNPGTSNAVENPPPKGKFISMF